MGNSTSSAFSGGATGMDDLYASEFMRSEVAAGRIPTLEAINTPPGLDGLDSWKEPLLYTAVRAGHKELVTFMLENKLVPKSLQWFSDSGKPVGLLEVAAYQGSPETFRALAYAGVKPGHGLPPVQVIAAYYGRPAILVACHEFWPAETRHAVHEELVDGLSAYHLAAGRGKIHVLRVLLNIAGAPAGVASRSNGTPLHAAARGPSYWYSSARTLDERLRYVRNPVQSWLVDCSPAPAGVEELEREARQSAPPADYAAVITELHAAGCKLDDASCGSSETPLMLAARFGHTQGLRTLVELGANVDATDSHGHGIRTYLTRCTDTAVHATLESFPGTTMSRAEILAFCAALDARRAGTEEMTDTAGEKHASTPCGNATHTRVAVAAASAPTAGECVSVQADGADADAEENPAPAATPESAAVETFCTGPQRQASSTDPLVL